MRRLFSIKRHLPARGKWALVVVFTAIAAMAFPEPAAAGDAGDAAFSITRGGQLYDKWFAVIDADAPEGVHPAYPAEGKYAGKGGADWRCKECHGWDYMGKDGAYATGKHFSGIVGIKGMAGADPAKIIAVLKDKTHALAGKMDAGDFQDLANFVSQGQIDMDRFIDRATKSTKGDNGRGKVYYNTLCVQCHGLDGRKPKEMKPFGAQMGNPWEVMHKIMNGQPAEEMPGLRALDPQIAMDIMAYLTTLPKK